MVFDGVVVNLIVGAGPTIGFGTYTNAQGVGTYLRLGLGVGLDVGAGGEHGGATSEAAFAGGGEALCGGAVFNGLCVGGNANGMTISGGPSAGPTEFFVNGHSEVTQTWVSRPSRGPVGATLFQCALSVVGGLGPTSCR